MTVEIDEAISIASLRDWLKHFVPVFQLMRSKTMKKQNIEMDKGGCPQTNIGTLRVHIFILSTVWYLCQI